MIAAWDACCHRLDEVNWAIGLIAAIGFIALVSVCHYYTLRLRAAARHRRAPRLK